MAVDARIRFRHSGCYSEKLSGRSRVVHLSADGRTCLCRVEADTRPEVERILGDMRGWLGEQPEIIADKPHSVLVRCGCPVNGLTPSLLEKGASVMWPVVHADGLEWWHLLAADPATMESVLAYLETIGDVEVERLSHPSPEEFGLSVSLSAVASDLTHRQLATLRAALAQGYFEHPRRVTIAKIAESLGMAESTCQEHLQKGERAIMKSFARLIVEHPTLEHAPMRKPGRPPAPSKMGRRDEKGSRVH